MKRILSKLTVLLAICFAQALLLPGISFGQYGPNDYVLSTQAQVDAFDPSLLQGKNLVISGTDISNINQLTNLVRVNGLVIENNPLLTSLAPLNNVDSVKGKLRIEGNSVLSNIDGFSSLKYINGITIANNGSLASIGGLNALLAMGPNKDTAPGVLIVQNNQSLVTISGFNAITKAADITIANNSKLTGITGFQQLTSVVYYLRYPYGMLAINNNPELTNLDGFLAIYSLNGLDLSGNSKLKNVHGFSNWRHIHGMHLNISNNAVLEDLDGLSNLNSSTKDARSRDGADINLDHNPLLTKPCGIHKILDDMAPDFDATRVHIEGSGFHMYQLSECGTPLPIPPAPMIALDFNQGTEIAPVNSGTLGANFSRSSGTPLSSTNFPANVGGPYSFDFGTAPGNHYMESAAPIDGLKNLSAFTLTGWLNCKSNTAGSGGNRVISWINNGGEGVDLVYQTNGSLRLGVDGWPDHSPAFSSAGKVPTSSSGAANNWVFFAVTYQSNGQVQFYFGNTTTDATLDVTQSYAGPGVTGSTIGKLAIGAFNDASRNGSSYDRMFRGLIDDVQIFNASLNYEKILAIQHATGVVVLPARPNPVVASKTTTSVTLRWAEPTTGPWPKAYSVYKNGVLSGRAGMTSTVITGLSPATAYTFVVRAEVYPINFIESAPLSVTTNPAATLPVIALDFNQGTGIAPVNSGTLGANFSRSSGTPLSSTNSPANVGGPYSFDFGTAPGNHYVESAAPIDGLKNLSAFTLTGWLNCKSNTAGSGGNRVISWINNGGEGVDLVYQTNGSLRLGVDGWPDHSPAFSSAGKVPTSSSGAANNWVFFAVTYQSNGQVQFYFGNTTTDATLDVTKSYAGPGVTGSTIGKLAIGAFNDATRNGGTYDRMFRGLIDGVQIFNASLNHENILAIQRGGSGSGDTTPPTTPNLALHSKTSTSVTLNWTAATDNVGVTLYEVYHNLTQLLGTTTNNSITLDGLSVDTEYSFSVRAKDAANNYSAHSNTIGVRTNKITDLKIVNTTPTTLTATWSTPPNSGITRYEFYNYDLTNGPMSGISLGLVNTYTTIVPLLPGSTQRVILIAFDAAGNSDSTEVTTTLPFEPVDTTPPPAPTSLVAQSVTSSSVALHWQAPQDQSDIAVYVVTGSNGAVQFGGSTPLTTSNIQGLNANTTYTFFVQSKDHAGNLSAPSNTITLTTLSVQSPLINLSLDENSGVNPVNVGSLSSSFNRSSAIPISAAVIARGAGSFGFGVNAGNYYVESQGVIDGLKNLSAFTITGWINNQAAVTGSGGNRIVSWINNGGDGVDLVYQSNGSLRLGVDQWPDNSPAFSSPSKVTTLNNATLQSTNWIFFAVTYRSNGTVEYYFGKPDALATLDVTRSYAGPGTTGSNIGKLALGNFNSATRNSSTYDRMFRGFMDDIHIFGSALSLSEIINVQQENIAVTPRNTSSVARYISETVLPEQAEELTKLFQNYPNPFVSETTIELYVPHTARAVHIIVNDLSGRLLNNIEVTERGKTSVTIGSGMNNGMYFYSLLVDGKTEDTKRMAITR